MTGQILTDVSATVDPDADSGPPPARRLFHHVGAEPSLHIYEIEVSHCVEVTQRDAG